MRQDTNATALYCFNNRFFYYGGSARGTSHKAQGTPCQDANYARIVTVDKTPWLIAAIADGVGSCILSHIGSAVAVKTAVEYCAAQLTLPNPDFLSIIRGSFYEAQDAVEEKAEEMKQLPFSFCSTLTLAIYDGKTLHFGHAGDDGLVALPQSGKITMVTQRHKGETANSVFPLQAGAEYWQIATVEEPVDGFALATDGVLDSFVCNQHLDNMVNEPFFTDLLFRDIRSEGDLERAMTYMDTLLNSTEYRKRVSDDLTLVIVGNTKAMQGRTPPPFDVAAWNARLEAEAKRIHDALYPGESATPPPKPQPMGIGQWLRSLPLRYKKRQKKKGGKNHDRNPSHRKKR